MTDYVETTATEKNTTTDNAHPPLDPTLRVNAILAAIGHEAKISPGATAKLRDLITKAIDERVGEMDDIRVGRVLGSALATL
jgi:hypothetical protein